MTDEIGAGLARDGYVFSQAGQTAALLAAHGDDPARFASFAASWDDLGLDIYMADGGRYRRRRFAAFAVGPQGITRKPHQPHYQSRDYNRLNGGLQRWFLPVTEAVATHSTLLASIAAADSVFAPLAGRPLWHVEMHQFRIEASAAGGLPTPEGLHRDGVDYVLVLLVNRRNIVSGTTRIHDNARKELGSFTLTDPLDAAWVDDHRVFHAVTPVHKLDATAPGHRDVLVLTFRR